jgi:D-glycero-D-manno-heptose 1,7-bisphosphate phosphatase
VPKASQRAIFADRDGTVIEDVSYIADPAQVKLVTGAAAALAALRDQGFRLVLVSNQSGIGRGLVTEEQARAVHDRFVSELGRHGIRLDDVRYCPHAPGDGCVCRKPLPGLLVESSRDLGIDLGRSYMVGDKPSDVEAGRRAGCITILLGPAEPGAAGADHVARGWEDVVRVVQSAAQAA